MLACFGLTCLAPSAAPAQSQVLYQPVEFDTLSLPNLCRDGGFEQADGNETAWRPHGRGFEIDREIRRCGRQSIRCRADAARGTSGASQRVELRQTHPAPILLEVWTRSEGIGFAPSVDFSLYADLTFADGSREWAQFAACVPDTRDWTRTRRILRPGRPVRTIDLFCVFANLPGTVWFDDAACRVLDPGIVQEFDGEAVRPSRTTTQPEAARWRGNALSIAGTRLLIGVQAHLADRAIRLLEPRNVVRQGPSLTAESRDAASGAIVRTRVVESEIGSLFVTLDAVTAAPTSQPVTVFVAAEPPGRPTRWWVDGNTHQTIDVRRHYASVVRIGAGKTGDASRYPLAVVTAQGRGTAVVAGREHPPVPTRFGYDGPSGLLYAACDAVVPVLGTGKSVRFHIEFQPVDEPGDFRAAWARLIGPRWPARADIEPGLWMPFAPISQIPTPADFGFAFKEGIDEVAYDDAHGVLTFRYCEPQSCWLKLPADVPRTYEACERYLRQAASNANHPQHRDAVAALASACRRADGRLYLWPMKRPWCDGCVIALSPDPAVPGPNKAGLNFDPSEARRYQAGGVDGEYLDTLDGWSDLIDTDPAHVATASHLSFEPGTWRPGVHNAVAIREYVVWLRRERSALGPPLLMANYCPTSYWWMAPLIDVMGQEVNWKIDGNWTPMSPEEMWYRRALCGRRPYGLLMNTDFDRWTCADTRRYFMRSTAYGFFPSFFSHNAADKQYFRSPALYERDRELFRRFVPVLKRLGRAGWEPEPHARVEPGELRIERFQQQADGPAYWTVHNPTDRRVSGVVRIERGRLPEGTIAMRDELFGGRFAGTVEGKDLRLAVDMPPDETLVLTAAPNP